MSTEWIMGQYQQKRFTETVRDLRASGTGDSKLRKVAEVLARNSNKDRATINRECQKAGLSPATIKKVNQFLR